MLIIELHDRVAHRTKIETHRQTVGVVPRAHCVTIQSFPSNGSGKDRTRPSNEPAFSKRNVRLNRIASLARCHDTLKACRYAHARVGGLNRDHSPRKLRLRVESQYRHGAPGVDGQSIGLESIIRSGVERKSEVRSLQRTHGKPPGE